MLKGISIEQAKQALTTLAKLHAQFANYTRDEQESLLPERTHPFCSPNARRINPLLGRAALKPCIKKYPDLMTEEVIRLCTRSIDHWDDLLDLWFNGDNTLIHGDSHLGNFFQYGEQQFGMIDWQAAQWAKGARDVQYFLINSMDDELLKTSEQSLVQFYVKQLALNGRDESFLDVWRHYRSYSFQTFLTEVVSIGLGTLTEQDDVMKTLLKRSIKALERLHYNEILNDLNNDGASNTNIELLH